jgi:fructose-1,6-bisphosphatase/inositol monophosphatase family enzyme
VTDAAALLELACRLAMEAGDAALAGRRAATLLPDSKSTATDLVTVFDRQAEARIVGRLAAERPRDRREGRPRAVAHQPIVPPGYGPSS